MSQTEDYTTGMKTERLNELAFSFKKTGAMVVALELGIFTLIDEGHCTVDALGKELDLDPEMIDRLISVLKPMDFVREVDGKLENFSDVSRYLVKTKPTYFGEYLSYQPKDEYDDFKNLVQNFVKPTGEAPDKRYYIRLMEDADTARKFTEAGYNASVPLAHVLTKKFDFSSFKRWLDVAGGSGCYSIVACEKYPELTTTIMDFPNVIAVARDFITKHNLEGRIETTGGNFLETPFPDGYDLISFITPLQSYNPDEVISVLKKTYDALPAGGTCLVVDYMLNDDKNGPLDPAFLNLGAVQNGHYTGRVQSMAEYRDFFAEAGFSGVKTEWLQKHMLGFIYGKKEG